MLLEVAVNGSAIGPQWVRCVTHGHKSVSD